MMLRERDEEIRAIAPYVMRATKCNRETAIHFLCSLSRAERRVIYKLRAVEKLNRPIKKVKRPRGFSLPMVLPSEALAKAAWSKPR